MKKLFFLPLIILLFTVIYFFRPFLFDNKLPIPADTIIGLYHPYRDLYAKDYPNGIPYKNFLITDPVRQQYPWRLLAIEQEKNGQLPLWNPYSMSGTPLAGSLQGAAFYPLNILFFVLPFATAWSILILLQPLLAGSFLYLYLRNLKIHPLASLIGGITFAFCGFSIAWLEWGTLVHIVLWLPLILLGIDKLESGIKNHESGKRTIFLWFFISLFALVASFFAGHMQIFFYSFVVVVAYFLARWIQSGKSKKFLFLFLLLTSCFVILTFIQWYPALQLIGQSARDVDQTNWHQAGWFIPWQHLIQFVAPDFFGNPTTLNYWGVWNYGELVGYVGLVPLLMAIFALFYRRDKKTFFFGSFFFLSLIFALPTFFATLPYTFNIPFLSTSQPTRLLLVTDFALSVLAALGIDWFIKNSNKKYIFAPLLFLLFVFGGLWLFVMQNPSENMLIAKRNLLLPTFLLFATSLVIFLSVFIKNKKIQVVTLSLLLLITLVDLVRFGEKFTPFSNAAYLFPSTKTLSFLQNQTCHEGISHSEFISESSLEILNQVQDDKSVRDDRNGCNKDQFRIMATDSRILPPNFSDVYHIQSVAGYDPLYLRRYGELIAASERGRPDISPPFGFNRIITPTNINSRIMDLLGVTYVVSFAELPAPKFTKISEEGMTKIYKNNESFPRAFFVNEVRITKNKQDSITALFDTTLDLRKTAVVEESNVNGAFVQGNISITKYTENNIVLQTENNGEGFVVLTDTYYPTWHAKICSEDGLDCFKTKIYLTDYNFRGVVVPSGKHRIEFYNSLL